MGSVSWIIIFTQENVQNHWLHKILKKPYWHCMCMRRIGDYVYYANPTVSNIDTKIFDIYSADKFLADLGKKKNTKILRFNYKFDFNNRIFTLWNIAPTCVTAVKMFLGIKSFAITPYQLYKDLIKRGAIVLN